MLLSPRCEQERQEYVLRAPAAIHDGCAMVRVGRAYTCDVPEPGRSSPFRPDEAERVPMVELERDIDPRNPLGGRNSVRYLRAYKQAEKEAEAVIVRAKAKCRQLRELSTREECEVIRDKAGRVANSIRSAAKAEAARAFAAERNEPPRCEPQRGRLATLSDQSNNLALQQPGRPRAKARRAQWKWQPVVTTDAARTTRQGVRRPKRAASVDYRPAKHVAPRPR